jgi:hypothetical protein
MIQYSFSTRACNSRREPKARGGPQQPFVAVYGHNFSAAFSRQMRAWAEPARL